MGSPLLSPRTEIPTLSIFAGAGKKVSLKINQSIRNRTLPPIKGEAVTILFTLILDQTDIQPEVRKSDFPTPSNQKPFSRESGRNIASFYFKAQAGNEKLLWVTST